MITSEEFLPFDLSRLLHLTNRATAENLTVLDGVEFAVGYAALSPEQEQAAIASWTAKEKAGVKIPLMLYGGDQPAGMLFTNITEAISFCQGIFFAVFKCAREDDVLRFISYLDAHEIWDYENLENALLAFQRCRLF